MFKFISKQTELDEKVYDLSVLSELLDAEYIAFDFETTGLDQFTLKPILLGLETGTYFGEDGRINTSKSNSYIIDFLTYSIEEVKEALLSLIHKLWIAHNLVYDYMILQHQFQIKLKNMHCTMLSSQVLFNGSDAIEHNYKAVVLRHFDKIVSKDDVASFINRDLTLPITRAELTYLRNDLVYLKPLYDRHLDLGSPLKKNLQECFRLENNFIRVMAHMMLNGISVDANKWMEAFSKNKTKTEEIYESLKKQIELLCVEFDIYDLVKSKKKVNPNQQSLFADRETISLSKMISKYNPRSSDQLLRFLNRLGVKIESTGEEILQQAVYKITDERIKTFINEVIELRGYEKLISTYGYNWLVKYINPTTGKVHTSYSQCLTDTGRLSSSKPNIQQIPATSEMREPFIADNEDYLLVSLDFSGQEVRLAASRSQDPLLLKSFNEGLDLHSTLAQATHRLIKEDDEFIVSKKTNEDLRNGHKPVLFSFIYLGGPKRVSEILNIGLDLGKRVYNKLKENLGGLSAWQKTLTTFAITNKYITDGTKFNRRQSFTIWRKKPLENHQIERKAANFPIQSSGASMCKEAAIAVLDKIENEKLDCQIKILAHDEILAQFPKNQPHLAEEFRLIMEYTGSSYLTNIKMESSMNIAPYWKK